MLEAFLPKSATRVVVYLEPINVRWGAQKLGAFCREVVGVEPDAATCFLFVNSRRDTLLLYFEDPSGEQTLTKKLGKGAFLLPARDEDGERFAILHPRKLSRLFRT